MGETPESHEAQRAQAPEANAVGVAIALGEARGDPALRGEVQQFLKHQRRLIDVQMAHLREQLTHIRLRHFELQLGVALRLLLVVAGAALVIGLASMVWQAREDHGLVVEAFSVPPDLAARGLTGQVIATRLLDKLTAMQAATDSARPANSYKNNWGDDLKVEIPETGVSFGELQRFLRGWLGHETHIAGEIVRTPSGVSITARAGEAEAKTFEGTEADLDALTQNSAEAIYEATQPYRYAALITSPTAATPQKGIAILKRLTTSADRVERAWAFLGLGNWQLISGNWAEARANTARAAELDSTLIGNTNIGWIDMFLGHDETALLWLGKALRQRWHVDPGAAETSKAGIRALVGMFAGEYASAADAYSKVETLSNYAGWATIAPAQRADALALTHNLLDAAAILSEHDWKDDATVLPLAEYSYVDVMPHYAISAAREDWGEAIADLEAVHASPRATQPMNRQFWLTRNLPRLAYATAMNGDVAGAEALIAQTPLDCYLCIRMRGQIAAIKHDWTGAEHWFAQGVQQGPSLPFAYMEWGEMLLAKGDADGAIAKLTLAVQKGPRSADPLELWGEALMRKSDFAGAVLEFAAADKFAPRWGRNHLRWGEALMKLGRGDEARAEFQAARGMDLSAADQRILATLH
jgi:tetratricopeptide (TPR) repeat protein